MPIPSTFSLHRAYILLRTLGLRQLVVTNEHNQVVGVVTRKDLMPFALDEKLSVRERPILELNDQLIS